VQDLQGIGGVLWSEILHTATRTARFMRQISPSKLIAARA
jgi:hypothetical protein